MDMNDRVLKAEDFVEIKSKISEVDMLAIKEQIVRDFSELNATEEQVERLAKNMVIKQILAVEDFERRQSESFTKAEVIEACLTAVVDEVLDFINMLAGLDGDVSDIATRLLAAVAPGAKVDESELEMPVFKNKPAIVSMDELMGPNGEEALRRASEQATINGLLAAGAVQITAGPEAAGGTSNDNEEVKVEMNEEFSLMASLSGSLNNVAKNITVRAEENVRSRSNVVNGGNTLFKLLSDNLRKAS